MVLNDDTQRKRPAGFESPADPSVRHMMTDDGPGCWLWGVVGLFSSLMAVAVVMLAAFAGWSDGSKIGQATEAATQALGIQDQCARVEQELAAGDQSYINVRITSLQKLTPVPACLANAIPSATVLYLTSLPTVTATATLTFTPAPTLEVTAGATAQIAPQATTAITGGSQFNPGPLLDEARLQISAAQWKEAADTLDAVMAIDPNYQTIEVKQLMFKALSEYAISIYRSTDGNLAEAILFTTRAERYGDLNQSPLGLNFERSVAQLYLDATASKGMNYPDAIRLYTQVIGLSPLYRDARAQLIDQYTKYGDLFAISGQNCEAVPQYEAALDLSGSDTVRVKRDNTVTACSLGTTPTVDPNQPGAPTADPNQPVAPTQPTVVPIGQQ